jgi:DNA-binding NarL/FixJ family response regulator
MNDHKIKLALIDDHILFRKGIKALMIDSEKMDCLFDTHQGHLFIEWLDTAGALPDVALIDIEMAGMNGIELSEKLQKSFPSIKIIILSMHFRESLVVSLVEKGVRGYLPKNAEPNELLNAIETVHNRGFYFNDTFLKTMHAAFSGNKKNSSDKTLGFGITAREKEVLHLICREFTTQEIADKLFLSVRTVDGHRNNLLQKTGARNSAGLVLFAIRNSIVDPWY